MKWNHYFVILLTFCLSASAALADKGRLSFQTIVSGEAVEHSDPIAQSTVRLVIQISDNEITYCTGSIFAENLILTAAHCLSPDWKSIDIVFAGKPESRQGDRVWIHPKYGVTGVAEHYDLALVHFLGVLPPGAVPAQIYVGTISEEIKRKQNVRVTIAGFGKTMPDGDFSEYLMKTEQTVVGVQGDLIVLATPVGRVESSACGGDSGGPAFIARDGVQLLWGVAKQVNRPFCMSESLYTDLKPYLIDLLRASAELTQQ